jgi:hypothetical protein
MPNAVDGRVIRPAERTRIIRRNSQRINWEKKNRRPSMPVKKTAHVKLVNKKKRINRSIRAGLLVLIVIEPIL